MNSQRRGFVEALRWLALSLLVCCSVSWASDSPPLHTLRLTPSDRILIVAPHPDDEVIGCGGIIQRAVEMRLPLRVVFLTHGDNNEFSFLLYGKHPVFVPAAVRRMGEIRHAEALTAAEILGVSANELIFLGYPDWGTFSIWCSYWGNRPAYRSMLTRVTTVSYPDAFRPGAEYKGEEILQDLETILREFHPTKVFVSHPADHQPDHRAAYLFTRVALWNAAPEVHSEIYPYLVHYHPKWPKPSRDPWNELLAPPPSLEEVHWRSFSLLPDQILRKEKALKAHNSQYRAGSAALSAFVRPNELFGDFPTGRINPVHPAQISEDVTEEDRAAFVGLTWQAISLEGDDLTLSFRFSRPLAKEVTAFIYLFGYRADHPFAEMPKVRVNVGMFHTAISDRLGTLKRAKVQVIRRSKEVALRIPLELLGDPQRILVSAHTSLGGIPLDRGSWHIVDLTALKE